MVAVVSMGTTEESSRFNIALAEQYDFVYAGVGWHPEDLQGITDGGWLTRLGELAQHPKVVCIGEIGLDYYWEENEPKEIQLRRLREQVDLAMQLHLPVSIHDREAHGDALEFIRQTPGLRGVFHCFSGSLEMAKELWKRGIYTGFGGSSTYKRNKKVREVLEACPAELLLLETDCPYLTPEPYRGRRNHPAMTEWQELAAQSTQNARALFDKM